MVTAGQQPGGFQLLPGRRNRIGIVHDVDRHLFLLGFSQGPLAEVLEQGPVDVGLSEATAVCQPHWMSLLSKGLLMTW
jgi:hypothetical protein